MDHPVAADGMHAHMLAYYSHLEVGLKAVSDYMVHEISVNFS